MLNRLKFSIEIKAEKPAIWSALWSDRAYRDWVSVFFEGSYALSCDWKEDSIVHFLGPNHNGIYSKVEKHIANKIMQFRHVGNVIAGEEQPIDEETKKWSGATEIYMLSQGSDSTILTVEIDVMDEHVDFMSKTFSLALEKVRARSLKSSLKSD